MRLFPILNLSWLKRLLPRGLFARSLLILVLPIVLIQIILAFVFFDNHWNRVTDRLVYAVAGETAIMVELIESKAVGLPINMIRDLNDTHLNLNTEYEEGGELLGEQESFSGWAHIIGDALVEDLQNAMDNPFRVSINMPSKQVIIQVAVTKGLLTVEVPLGRLFSSTAYIFLLWMAGVSVLLAVIAILFMRNQIRPIKRLAIASDWFGKGRDVSFFKVSGSREVRLAAQSFLNMKERIQKQVAQRTSMLAGVSHDLRTPLTRMKLQLEMMEECADTAAMKSDINDMERMVDAYLQFARGDGDEQSQDVDMQEFLAHCVKQMTIDGFDLTLEAAPLKKKQSYDIPLRLIAFERCVSNVVSNAKRYSDKAVINLSRDEDYIFISIDDNGDGIAEEEYGEVFKPFYRGDKARNLSASSDHKGSVGLGLSIAQDIVLSHGGKIELGRSSALGGLSVQIALPL